MRTRWVAVLCLGAVVTWGACDRRANGDNARADAESGADSSNRADTQTDAAYADSAHVDAAPADSASPDATRALVALSGDGLMLVNPNSGSTRALQFGTDEAVVIDALTRALGTPGEREANLECGMGPLQFVEFDKGLVIAVQKGKFLGWSIHHNGESLRTMSNIGVMSTRAELESVYAAEIAPSSLGIEFMAGGLQGVLSSAADSGRISDFWAGANCVAR